MKYTTRQLAQWLADHEITHQGKPRNAYYWEIIMKDAAKAEKIEQTVVNYCNMITDERRKVETIQKLILRYLKSRGHHTVSSIGDIYDAVFPKMPLLPGTKDYKDDDTHWHWRSIISWEIFHLMEDNKIVKFDRDEYRIA